MRSNKMFKSTMAMALAGVMLAGTAMTSFAAGWQQDQNGWWYGTNEDNTTRYTNGWQWIDGNGDNIAECYYFDENGYILTNAFTPDGYTVNADGAWVGENRIVQTQIVDASKVSKDTYDVRDYDSQGISKAAVDILLHTKEENAKYGGTDEDVFGWVYYENGLHADYYLSKDGRPTQVRSDNDSTRLIRETIHATRQDAEALKTKGYDVSYGIDLAIEGFWEERLTFSIAKGAEAEYSRLEVRRPDKCANWGIDWGY